MRSIDLSTPSIPSLSQKNLSSLPPRLKRERFTKIEHENRGSALHLQRGGKEGEGRGIPLIRASMIISSRIYISFFSSFPRSKPPSTLLWLQRASRLRKERKKRGGGRKEGRRVEWITRALIARGRTVGGRGRGEASSWGVCSFVVEDV